MQLIMTVIVSGTNIMGNPLCEMTGVLLTNKNKVKTQYNYSGPVINAADVGEAIQNLFKEKGLDD